MRRTTGRGDCGGSSLVGGSDLFPCGAPDMAIRSAWTFPVTDSVCGSGGTTTFFVRCGDTPAAARATLDVYLELADYNCRPAQLNSVHSAYELFAPHEDDPRIVGVATIEPYTELDARRDLNTVLDAVTRPTALAC